MGCRISGEHVTCRAINSCSYACRSEENTPRSAAVLPSIASSWSAILAECRPHTRKDPFRPMSMTVIRAHRKSRHDPRMPRGKAASVHAADTPASQLPSFPPFYHYHSIFASCLPNISPLCNPIFSPAITVSTSPSVHSISINAFHKPSDKINKRSTAPIYLLNQPSRKDEDLSSPRYFSAPCL